MTRSAIFVLSVLAGACAGDLIDDAEVERLDQEARVLGGGGLPTTQQPAGSTAWARVAGGAGWDSGYAAVADGTGWAVTGTFQGTVDFGCGALKARGNSEMFVVRLSSSGACTWQRRVGGAGDAIGTAIARGPGGMLVVAGSFAGSMDFDAGPLTSAGPYDGFVAAFSSSGANLWRQPLVSDGEVYPSGVAVDGNGNLAVAGSFAGTAWFAGTELIARAEDLFLARFSAAGAPRWAAAHGGPGYDAAADVAIDGSGNIVIAGSFEGTASFGGAPLASAGGFDAVVARFDGSGGHQWSIRHGGAGDDTASAVAVHPTGDIGVAGYFQQQLQIGAITVHSAAGYAAYAARLSSAGTARWALTAGEAGAYMFADAARFDGDGNLYVTGTLTGSASLGSVTLTSQGDSAVFVTKLTPAGAVRWAKSYGGAGQAGGLAVATGSSTVLVTGYSGAQIDLGRGPLAGRGGFDAPLLAINP